MRALWIALFCVACAPQPSPSSPAREVAARGSLARLVLACETGCTTAVASRVREALLEHGVQARVDLVRDEVVIALAPEQMGAAEAALPRAPEFFVAEVDEAWSLDLPGPWATVDERESWAGERRTLRTVVAAPEHHDRLARELRAPPGRRFVVGKNLLTHDLPDAAHAVLVTDDPIVTGRDLEDVEVVDEGGLEVVYATFGAAGREALRRATTGRAGFRIALVLDGRVLMAPVILAPIEDGRARIDVGDGRPASARRLAEELRRSVLPSVRVVRRDPG